MGAAQSSSSLANEAVAGGASPTHHLPRGEPATKDDGEESAEDLMRRTGSEEFSHTTTPAAPLPPSPPGSSHSSARRKPAPPAAATPPFRLLTLEGQTGAVFCRVHDTRSQRTLPSLSDAGRFECATRSLLRMFNLAVFRGRDREGSMVGPGDYFCNVERPHASLFTVDVPPSTTEPPRFVPHDHAGHNQDGAGAAAPPRPRPVVTGVDTAVVGAEWVSGQFNPTRVAQLVTAHKKNSGGGADPFGGSLFPHPGLLLVDSQEGTSRIDLPAVDATTLDLSGFKARLVRNNVPFRLVDAPLPAKDEFRPVSYDFGRRYAEHCVEGGAGGLFLETHTFTQTMTPLDAYACGFIVLGRWLMPPRRDDDADDADQLELIAVRIPFGWTIVVDAGCMHGDSTFVGTYMMSMTSNHVTMESADTVFLKRRGSSSSLSTNIDLRCDAHRAPAGPRTAPRPIVCFSEPTEAELQAFRAETAGVSFMLQPFSKLSWATTLYRRFNWYPAAKTTTTPTAAAPSPLAPEV